MLPRMCGSVLSANVSAQSPPCSRNASPRATSASCSCSSSTSPGTHDRRHALEHGAHRAPPGPRATPAAARRAWPARRRAACAARRAAAASSGKRSIGTSTVQFTPTGYSPADRNRVARIFTTRDEFFDTAHTGQESTDDRQPHQYRPPAGRPAAGLGNQQGDEPRRRDMWRADDDRRFRAPVFGVELYDCVPDWDRLVAAIDWASRMLPRMRERVVDSPLGIGVRPGPSTPISTCTTTCAEPRYPVKARGAIYSGRSRRSR